MFFKKRDTSLKYLDENSGSEGDEHSIEEESDGTKDKEISNYSNIYKDEELSSDSDLDPILDLDNIAPPEFICPITMSIMRDPVLMPDGQTYEREAIQKHLKINPISPITREKMDISQARVNYAIKSLIDQFIQDHKNEFENPQLIDPNTMNIKKNKIDLEIPITGIKKIKLDKFSAQYTSDSMLITIKPQKIKGRLPVSIIAIIDISGSMKYDATLAELKENQQISRIQLVQMSLKTIISTLGDSDQITIITFNKKARIKASAVKLTQYGKQKIIKIIDKLKPHGNTNLWGGINKGIDEVTKQQTKNMNTSLLVFTDGEPNIHPPLGLIPTLKNKINKNNIFYSISTISYGYEIDADLLEEISEIGNGIYGYCPNSSMVGTTLVHYISNLISIVSPLTTLTVNVNENDKYQFNVILYNNAETNVMIPLNKDDDPKSVIINLKPVLTRQTFLIDDIKQLNEDDDQALLKFNDQRYRKLLIDTIVKTKENLSLEEMRSNVIDLYEKIKEEKIRSQFMRYLMIDLYNNDDYHGEIERAFKKEFYNKWGKNYVYSLLRFHVLEQCGNSKAMSLQLY